MSNLPTTSTIFIDGSPVDESVGSAKAAELETIFGVELVTIGTWNASTGVVKFTKEHLQSIIDSQDDPCIKSPRLIIGHTPSGEEWDEKFMGGTLGKDGFFG